MVGAQPFWTGREVQPFTFDYWETIEGVTDLAYDQYGLRVQWVIFADAQVMMPDEIDRAAWVDRWAAFANLRSEKVLFLELANEFWENGLNARELVDLTARLGSQTEVLVAASTPAGHDCASWESVYRGGQADLARLFILTEMIASLRVNGVLSTYRGSLDHVGGCLLLHRIMNQLVRIVQSSQMMTLFE